MKPLFGTFILKCVFIIKPPITYAQTYHTINCVSTVNNQHLTQDLILSVTHTQYMALVHCLPGDVLCHTAYCYTTKGNPPSLSSFILWIHPPISHRQILWDILSQLAGKTREVTSILPASLPPETGEQNYC